MTSLLVMMSISAAGLGALLQMFPAVFDALRLIGAAYLAYLGVKNWRSPTVELSKAQSGTVKLEKNALHLFRQGMLVAASNPKAILFAVAFLPQFINPQNAQLPQFATLLATFAAVEVSWYFVYAASGKRLAVYLARASVLKVFNRVTGGAFIGFAAMMAAVKD